MRALSHITISVKDFLASEFVRFARAGGARYMQIKTYPCAGVMSNLSGFTSRCLASDFVTFVAAGLTEVDGQIEDEGQNLETATRINIYLLACIKFHRIITTCLAGDSVQLAAAGLMQVHGRTGDEQEKRETATCTHVHA